MLSQFNPANISFSQHALTRMAERNISKDEVIAVLKHPREVIESSDSDLKHGAWFNAVRVKCCFA